MVLGYFSLQTADYSWGPSVILFSCQSVSRGWPLLFTKAATRAKGFWQCRTSLVAQPPLLNQDFPRFNMTRQLINWDIRRPNPAVEHKSKIIYVLATRKCLWISIYYTSLVGPRWHEVLLKPVWATFGAGIMTWTRTSIYLHYNEPTAVLTATSQQNTTNERLET